MDMTFRWYGQNDPVTLEYISQIPLMSGVVTAVYDVPVGQVWPLERIMALKQTVNAKNLKMEVIESVPVHEDIKMGAPNRDALIENYCATIRNLGAAGVKVICYNFMPVFDWLRSDLKMKTPDGATCLAYDQKTVNAMDPAKGELSLPGWDESYTKEQLQDLLNAYKSIDENQLMENLIYFLKKIIPVCEECDVKMAIHPDDPPWSMFGLPRIITGEAGIDKMFAAVDSKYNGLTLCTGSLGCSPKNDMVKMAAKYAKMGRIHFLHARNIRFTGEAKFNESPHPTACGSLDMYGIMKALYDNGFDGYTRPDHGRNIWGEDGRPGYGLYDRALGASYINGLWEAIVKGDKK